MSDAVTDRPFPDPELEQDGVFEFSASAISTGRDCKRKWGFKYIDGFEQPQSKATALGTAVHKELENWFLKKEVPQSIHAKRLLPHLPHPTHPGIEVEHAFRILFPVGAARGFIDLVIPQPNPKLMPPGPWRSDIPVVIDHKTTSNLFYAKDQTQLLTDPQALLYGTEARRLTAQRLGSKITDIKEVDFQLGYVQTRGAADTKQVRIRQSLPILEEGLGVLLDDARQLAEAKAHGITADLDYDLRSCEKYGGCPYRDRCDAYLTYTSGPATRQPVVSDYASPMSSELLKKLRAASATPPKATPEADSNAIAPPTVVAPTVVSGNVVKPSPEPALPHPDTSGLSVPLPEGSSPINSPQGAPNVSPTDPLPPVIEGEIVETPKRTRKPRTVKPETEATDGVIDDSMDSQEIADVLKKIASQALKQNRLVLAAQTITTLQAVLSGA